VVLATSLVSNTPTTKDGHAATSVSGVAYTYNANGSLTGGDGRTIGYTVYCSPMRRIQTHSTTCEELYFESTETRALMSSRQSMRLNAGIKITLLTESTPEKCILRSSDGTADATALNRGLATAPTPYRGVPAGINPFAIGGSRRPPIPQS
jgi:hypothetical protein